MTKDNLTQFSASLQEFNSQLPILKDLIFSLHAQSYKLQNKLDQLNSSLKEGDLNEVFPEPEPKVEPSDLSCDPLENIQELKRLFEELGPGKLENWLKRIDASSIEELPQDLIASKIKDVTRTLFEKYDYENIIEAIAESYNDELQENDTDEDD